ncbi:MAG TPA: tRNA lysidine(34) synthetase TilS [Planctomycetes bacterium]|nr:tRNA lysidine(34) synthetase TilS [Planctomycetota bacterium]
MCQLQSNLEARLAAAWPPAQWADVTVLVAVSGGSDSVALLRMMVALKRGGRGQLAVAHCNHQLRGAEADEDERFVVALCESLGLPCHVGRSRPVRAGSDGLEGSLRKARYGFLQSQANRLGARYVATAHTADDQAETVLHRILRGTSIAGLAGIPRTRPLGPACTLIRPLLGFRRSELVAYLHQSGQPYRSDSSNVDQRFTRNRIRHDLLPRLARQFNPNVLDALLRLSGLAAEAQQLIDAQVEQLADGRIHPEPGGGVQIDARGLEDLPRLLLRQLLVVVWRRCGWPMQSMGFDHWESLAEMLFAAGRGQGQEKKKRVFPAAITAEMAPGVLRLVPSTGRPIKG